VSCQLHAQSALVPLKEPSYLLSRRLSGCQSQSGSFGGKKSLVPTGIQTADCQTECILHVLHLFLSTHVACVSHFLIYFL